MTTLKKCLYQTIHKNKKSLEEIAEELDMSTSYLTRSALPDTSDHANGSGCRFPLKKLPALIKSTGDYQVLDKLEQMVGRVAFKLPCLPATTSDLHKLTLEEVAAFGQFIAEVSKNLQQDKLSRQDKERIIEDGFVVIGKVYQFIQTVKKA